MSINTALQKDSDGNTVGNYIWKRKQDKNKKKETKTMANKNAQNTQNATQNVSKDMRTEENRKAVNAIMCTMSGHNAHFGKGDSTDSMAVNRYFTDIVKTRSEVYIHKTYIAVYAGSQTPLFTYLTTACKVVKRVQQDEKECRATFTSIDDLKHAISEYNKTVKQATQTGKGKAQDTTQKAHNKPKATSKANTTKKVVKAS